MAKFIDGKWMSEADFRQWRAQAGYERYINYNEALRKIPQFTPEFLNSSIKQLEKDIAHPDFDGPGADENEQARIHTLLEMLHAERGYRLGLSGLKSA